MKTKKSNKTIEDQLRASWNRNKWLADTIMAYLEGGHSITVDKLCDEEDDEKHIQMRREIARAINIDFDAVDYAISKMFF